MQAVRAAVKPINLLCSGPAEADGDQGNDDDDDDDDYIIIRSVMLMTIFTVGTVLRTSRGL